ncbi:hypothetical protein BASA81_003327 [Batrachochytrium salamandrivorans]|nr:hypothetical protein BASA81_003327 [Batrachochytrium salamandrivorans]
MSFSSTATEEEVHDVNRRARKSSREKQRRQQENDLLQELAVLCQVPPDLQDKGSILKYVIQRIEVVKTQSNGNGGGGGNSKPLFRYPKPTFQYLPHSILFPAPPSSMPPSAVVAARFATYPSNSPPPGVLTAADYPTQSPTVPANSICFPEIGTDKTECATLIKTYAKPNIATFWAGAGWRVAERWRLPVSQVLRLHVQQGVQLEQRRSPQLEQQPQSMHRGGHAQGLRPKDSKAQLHLFFFYLQTRHNQTLQ